MPLPKPLKRGASKRKKRARVGEVLSELKQGRHHKERTHDQEVAIALGNAGLSRKDKRKANRTTKRKTARKKKRSFKRTSRR